MRSGWKLMSVPLAALLVAAMLALPAGALADSGFTGLTGGGGTTTQTTTTSTATTAPPVTIPTNTSTSSGLPTYAYILIAIVVVILFGGITYFIRHDAHAHAPRHAARELNRGRGTVAPQTERRKRNRAKARAARRARRPRRN